VGHYTLYFAQAYGEGSYGTCAYSEGETSAGVCAGAGTGTGTGGNSGGGLANTGLAIAGIVTLACLLVFVALVVRVWRRKPVAQEVVADETSVRHDQRSDS
jgi:hypothetical protein